MAARRDGALPACAAILVGSALLLTGCTAGPHGATLPSAATPPTSSPAATAAPGTAATAVAGSDVDAIRRAIERFNSTAGGPATAQQLLLAQLVAPGQQAGQRACPSTTNTVSFEPVYAFLAPSPTWKPEQGAMTGTVYSLPALIRIHSGNRITGTDLTDLHLAVNSGRVEFPALCVS